MTQSFEVVCSSADRPAWLAARSAGIGASDMPAILGVDRYKSELELYLIKTGQVAEESGDSEAAQWGHELEGKILEAFGKRTGRVVTRAGSLLRSKAHPWAMCTLDGWQVTSLYEGRAIPVECKLTGAFGRDWDEGVPEYFMPQIQQQMLVTDAPMASFACLINGTRLVHADVPRDEVMIQTIIHEGERFWRAVGDGSTPLPDGSESAGWALSKLYANDAGATVALGWEVDAMTERHDQLCEQLKELGREKERIRQTIQQRMGDATTGVLPGTSGGWAWKRQKRAGYTVEPTEFRAMRRQKASGAR